MSVLVPMQYRFSMRSTSRPVFASESLEHSCLGRLPPDPPQVNLLPAATVTLLRIWKIDMF